MAKMSKGNAAALNKAQALIDEALGLVQEVRDELRDAFDEKTERWQESDAGQSASEQVDSLDAIDSDLENVSGAISGILDAA